MCVSHPKDFTYQIKYPSSENQQHVYALYLYDAFRNIGLVYPYYTFANIPYR